MTIVQGMKTRKTARTKTRQSMSRKTRPLTTRTMTTTTTIVRLMKTRRTSTMTTQTRATLLPRSVGTLRVIRSAARTAGPKSLTVQQKIQTTTQAPTGRATMLLYATLTATLLMGFRV